MIVIVTGFIPVSQMIIFSMMLMRVSSLWLGKYNCEKYWLTPSQTTYFRLFQTERVSRQQFQIW